MRADEAARQVAQLLCNNPDIASYAERDIVYVLVREGEEVSEFMMRVAEHRKPEWAYRCTACFMTHQECQRLGELKTCCNMCVNSGGNSHGR